MAQQANTTSAPPSDSPNTNTGVHGSQNQTVDLLNASTYTWKPVNYAKVSQSNDNLDITVETDNPDKIYNRAYLQTQLNFTQNQPLVLLLDYAAETFEGNTTFAIEVKDEDNNNILLSRPLIEDETSVAYLLTRDIIDKPIEIVLYLITEDRVSSTLALNDASISTLAALTSTLESKDTDDKSSLSSEADKRSQDGIGPFPWIFRQ